MQEHIENLVKLQGVELERARLGKELRELPGEISQALGALAGAEKQAAETSDSLSREETLRTRLEREITGHKQKATRFRAQLDDVKTPRLSMRSGLRQTRLTGWRTKSWPAWSGLRRWRQRLQPSARK
jgi:predicted  nucleic acid-binding Zn-ribbon protein